MTGDIPHSAVLLLAALTQSTEFLTYEDTGRMVLRLGEHLVEVKPDDLAALQRRALISFEDDDEGGMPRRLEVTDYGKAFLKRHLIANRIPPYLRLVPKGS